LKVNWKGTINKNN